ncbi:unnamed protein product [Caenorhabditis auriculariae]|uniref:TGF-beta family profile domain-containing protein n=1 Tax=Caenorhabditis auriculariae TaxID=2777116 RepID=A0A8S1H921_9PELO|nr:unnamed protein product [Caenorhabditis auriculariae]
MRTVPWFSFFAVFGVISVDVDVDVFNETIKDLLRFRTFPPNETVHRKLSHAATRHMRTIYDNIVEDDGCDDGNLVRAIDASVGKFNGEEVLVFDVDGFASDESIMRAELHFTLRKKEYALARRRSRQIRARSVCVNDYCREQSLKRIHGEDLDDVTVVWDATKVVFESFHLDASQVVFKITRDHTKMRPYVEMVRKSSPFLVIYSQANHTIDTATVTQRAENTRRQRRQIGGAYYSYSSKLVDENAPTTVKSPTGRRHRLRKEEEDDEDVWKGFGDNSDVETSTDASNDVRVVLLNEKKCSKLGNQLRLKEFGWSDVVMEPSTFETSYCKGSCSAPFSSGSNPTNHAMLQSLFASNEPVCCAPAGLQSLTFLYKDERSRLVIRNYPSMTITSCACL